MRRTLALAGIAVLGVTGLSGPASADPGAGIAHHDAVIVNEVAADLNPASPHGLEGGAIEIKNNTSGTVNIGGWRVTGCTTADSFQITVVTGFMLSPQETFLVGDPDFTGAGSAEPNQFFTDAGEVLLQAAGGARVENATGGLQNEIRWGTNPVSCASTLADVSPIDAETLNHPLVLNDPWINADPTLLRGNPA